MPSSPSSRTAPPEAPSWAVAQESEEQDTSGSASFIVEQCGDYKACIITIIIIIRTNF